MYNSYNPNNMKRSNRMNQKNHFALALALGFATSAAFLTGSARADTTITSSSPVTVTDPNTYFGSAGTITIDNDATLSLTPSAQGTYTIAKEPRRNNLDS